MTSRRTPSMVPAGGLRLTAALLQCLPRIASGVFSACLVGHVSRDGQNIGIGETLA